MEQNGTDFADDLTDRQQAALPYPVASPNLSQGAKLADIGRSTLYRWMDDHEFRETLQRLRAEAAELAHEELKGLMLKGVIVIAQAMEDENLVHRLRAARAAVALGLKAVDLKELRQRVDHIDDAFKLWAKRQPPI